MAMGGRSRKSARAKTKARMSDGTKLTTTEIRVLGRGLTPCMPMRAKMAALPNPRPDNKDNAIAVMVYRAVPSKLAAPDHQKDSDDGEHGTGGQPPRDPFQPG